MFSGRLCLMQSPWQRSHHRGDPSTPTQCREQNCGHYACARGRSCPTQATAAARGHERGHRQTSALISPQPVLGRPHRGLGRGDRGPGLPPALCWAGSCAGWHLLRALGTGCPHGSRPGWFALWPSVPQADTESRSGAGPHGTSARLHLGHVPPATSSCLLGF